MKIGHIAREPDGEGFFADVTDRGEILASCDGFQEVQEAIDWVLERAQSAIVRFGFSPEHEYAIGPVADRNMKSWPPSEDERRRIEAHVRTLVLQEIPDTSTLEVVEPEIRRIK